MRTSDERIRDLERRLQAAKERAKALEGLLRASRLESARLQAIVWSLLYPAPGLLENPKLERPPDGVGDMEES